KRAYCLKTQPATGETYPKSDLFNKAIRWLEAVGSIVLRAVKSEHCPTSLSPSPEPRFTRTMSAIYNQHFQRVA
ncbi:hypothetical protein, partial [Klebsiella variicola]|uniref:hypothetical protein n=1 Tax=Klebsiella variicola TaxID=244366 RepID=UPI001C64A45A